MAKRKPLDTVIDESGARSHGRTLAAAELDERSLDREGASDQAHSLGSGASTLEP